MTHVRTCLSAPLCINPAGVVSTYVSMPAPSPLLSQVSVHHRRALRAKSPPPCSPSPLPFLAQAPHAVPLHACAPGRLFCPRKFTLLHTHAFPALTPARGGSGCTLTPLLCFPMRRSRRQKMRRQRYCPHPCRRTRRRHHRRRDRCRRRDRHRRRDRCRRRDRRASRRHASNTPAAAAAVLAAAAVTACVHEPHRCRGTMA